MPKRRQKLTPQLTEAICAFIRAGGFVRVAVEAAGVKPDDFDYWLEKAKQTSGPATYRDFATKIRQAQAQARLTAEIEVFKNDPLAWLRSGPGKERKDREGWTTTVKPQLTDNRSVNVQMVPSQLAVMFGEILQMLTPFPEARQKVSALLGGPAESPSAAIEVPEK